VIVVIGSEYYGRPLQHIDEVAPGAKVSADQWEKEVSLVMFTGGEDVHPCFYRGKDSSNVCATNFLRDAAERDIFRFCKAHNIKMTGICRGFQFLNVMAGGFMYQHITGHAGVFHEAYFPYDRGIRKVTSTHHQLVGLASDSIPIAWSRSKLSKIYIGPYGHRVDPPAYEMEAAIFPNINAMGVQYHPEMLRKEDPCRIHYSEMISDFVKMEMKEFITKYGRRTIHVRNRQAGHTRRES
jgi:gamma-glutamyl-gamma-aminobutyrate hydrolase PuuD